MTSRWIVLCRIATLIALGASSALYIQYLSPVDATFCGLESGCEAVRQSKFSYFGSAFLSMPLVGLIAYATVFVLSLRGPDGRAFPLVAGAGALAALGLIAVQAFVVGEFCWLCVTVDIVAIAAGAFALLHARYQRGAAESFPAWTWYALAGIALVAPPGWAKVKPAPPVPEVIRALYVPGKINIVEFADFECPFCRAFHPILKEALKAYPESQIHFVRMNVPLPQHEYAEPAARAYLCAEAQNKAEAMADVLVEADFGETPPRRFAVELGLDMRQFDRCVADAATTRRIERETEVLKQAGMRGLPTTYIGGKRFIGIRDIEDVRDALDRAVRGETDKGVPLAMYLAIVAAAIAAVAWFGRRSRANLRHGSQS